MSLRRLAATVSLLGTGTFAVLELAQTLFRSDHAFSAPMSDYALGRYGFLQTIAFAALRVASLALAAEDVGAQGRLRRPDNHLTQHTAAKFGCGRASARLL